MDEILLDDELERITVIAVDPEDGPLQMIWSPPPFAEGSSSVTPSDGVFVARQDLVFDERLDGQILSLSIIDDERAIINLEWTLVIP